MITLNEAYEIIQSCNDNAYVSAYSVWLSSDEEEEGEQQELAREKASYIQAEYFREEYEVLSLEVREAIMYYCQTDKDFNEQFLDWWQ